jgi:hypothetical protein
MCSIEAILWQTRTLSLANVEAGTPFCLRYHNNELLFAIAESADLWFRGSQVQNIEEADNLIAKS